VAGGGEARAVEATADGLARVVAVVGAELEADRCWLYARDPRRWRGIALVRWLRGPGTADVPADLRRWTAEAPGLAGRDPLFARALAGTELDLVADAEADDVDRALERALGHRAFAHLNLHAGGELWGTLQPGMTGAPRAWTDADRRRLLDLRPALGRALAALVARDGERLESRRLVGPPP
jgi:GAF domain-containing protein